MSKKINKKITIDEFKMWLEGLETFQPPNWAPTFDQWQLIRDKIFSLISHKESSKESSKESYKESYKEPFKELFRDPLKKEAHVSTTGYIAANTRQNPALIPIESDIGDTEIIKMPPPIIPRK